MLCGLAPNLPVLVLARILKGLQGGRVRRVVAGSKGALRQGRGDQGGQAADGSAS